MRLVHMMALVGFASLLDVNAQTQNDTFAWETLNATDTLVWIPCYSTFECTRLSVPRDYTDSSKGTAGIAIIRLPSPLAGTSEYRGPVLFNPGGPGGSGVEFLVEVGPTIFETIGEQFDAVGFDPRGVTYSTPKISFFPTDAERAIWNAGQPPIVASTLPQAWAKSQLIGNLTKARDKDNILEYVSTDNVARDMLQINKAYGRDTLQYYGFSYGSVLGATFATLFPKNVERLVIDGVLDMEGYYQGNGTNQMLDTDRVFQMFFDSCASAGPDLCAFYAPTAAAISTKLDQLLERVRETPIPVIIDPSFYGLVDDYLVRTTILSTLYTPYDSWPMLATALADLENGNGTLMYSTANSPVFQCNCTQPSSFVDNNFEAVFAIANGDAIEVHDSVKDLKKFFKHLESITQFPQLVATLRISASGWKVFRKGRFLGPVGGNTSFPLLLVGNTADPVTPLAGAIKTSKGFPGSVVLVQDSPGHTSRTTLANCTQGYIRAYFLNGTLPEPGTVCPVEATLFNASSTMTGMKRNLVRRRWL